MLEGYWRPHTAEQIRLVYSLSKSFTGTALGLAIGDGLVDLDDLVGDHLPELTADASARTLEMRVRHLASMSTGHADETLLDAFIAKKQIDQLVNLGEAGLLDKVDNTKLD